MAQCCHQFQIGGTEAMALGTVQDLRRIPREERVLRRKAGWTLSQSARPAITKPHRRGRLHDRHASSPILEGRPAARALAGLAPPAGCRGWTGPGPLPLAGRRPPSPFVFTWRSLSLFVSLSNLSRLRHHSYGMEAHSKELILTSLPPLRPPSPPTVNSQVLGRGG